MVSLSKMNSGVNDGSMESRICLLKAYPRGVVVSSVEAS